MIRRSGVPVGLLAATAALWWAGRGALAPPPLDAWDSLGALRAWAEQRDAVVVVMVAVRLAALAVVAWLAVAALVAASGQVVVAQRLLPARLRVLAGVSVVALTAAGPAQDGAGDEPDTATLVVVEGPAPDTPAPVPGPVPASSASSASSTWTVAPGESFWSIAEDVLADAWGRPPTDAEIVPYWRRLMAANRDRLATGNPDLIFAGQEFVLPPVNA